MEIGAVALPATDIADERFLASLQSVKMQPIATVRTGIHRRLSSL